MPAWSSPRPSSRRRAQHAVRPLAAQLAALDLHAVGHHRAERGQRHEVADRHVERAAADLERLAVAGVDVDELDLGRRRDAAAGRAPAADDDAVEPLADARRSSSTGEAEVAQRVGRARPASSSTGANSREPGEEDLHAPQNCSRKRMSLVNMLAEVVDAVALRGQAVDAEAEGEAGPLLGVEAAGAQHVGVHHAAAAELEPRRRRGAGCRTRPTAR